MTDLPPPPPPPPPPPNFTPPPGYVAYGGPGVPVQGIQRIGGISKAMVILLGIMVPLQIVGIFDSLGAVEDARDYLNGTITEDEFLDSSGGIGAMSGLFVLPIAVLTMVWMYRMARNLRALGRNDATWAPGWAIGGWFVPPMVLYVVPWLMFRELWRGSDPDTPGYDPGWRKGPVSPLVTVWWVLYGLVPIAGLATSAGMVSGQLLEPSADDLAEQLDQLAGVTIALSVVQIAATIVYLLLVRQLSERHMRATREV